jgi:Sulfotransferase family
LLSTAPSFPLGVRMLNAVGAAARLVRLPLVSLDPAALLTEAERRTELTDFGDDVFGNGVFRVGLERLCASWENDADLTLLGRIIARRDALRLLENRLRMTQVWRRNAEIGHGRIEAPIFILGLPRTGTTILHDLLALDPASRVPMTWEVMHPWPPPERASFDRDPRIAVVEKHYAGVDALLPGFKTIHPMGARLPQECVALTAHDFATLIHLTTHRVPSYQIWLDRLDLRPVYASHRRQLQYLQWRCPGDRWVLKSPGHLWALDALLTVYPDARIVQTHRDPLRVLASLVSLIATLRGLASSSIDPHEIARDWSTRLADGLEHTMAVRERCLADETRVFDLHFRDFVGNELACIRRLYAHFDLELSPGVQGRMQAFLRDHPADAHGSHTYDLAGTGLDGATERGRFARYQDRHGVASEPIG